VALCVGTTILIKMNRERYAWVTLAPMLFLLVVTMSAGWQKIVRADAAGFLPTIVKLRAQVATATGTDAARATEELLTWLEACTAEGHPPPVAFLRTAARLLYEHARLVIGPSHQDINALAERLAAMHEKRPQAARWTRSDWRNMARLVLENRPLPVPTLFSNHPPSAAELLENPLSAKITFTGSTEVGRRLIAPRFLVWRTRGKG